MIKLICNRLNALNDVNADFNKCTKSIHLVISYSDLSGEVRSPFSLAMGDLGTR